MSILLKNLFWVCFFLFVPLSLFPFPELELVEYRSGIIKGEDVIVLPQFPGGEEAMKKYLVIDVLMPEGPYSLFDSGDCFRRNFRCKIENPDI